jgi:hypothetical protein
MPAAARVFRVFVSSTFGDLTAERAALQDRVFPRLQALCAQRGAQFQPIDLRWEVTEEASLDQQAVTICLEEVSRCRKTTTRPNFLLLLGDRYGWRPPPPRIPSAEFDALRPHLPARPPTWTSGMSRTATPTRPSTSCGSGKGSSPPTGCGSRSNGGSRPVSPPPPQSAGW